MKTIPFITPSKKIFRVSYGGSYLKFQLLRKLRQKDHKLQISLGNFMRPCLEIKTKSAGQVVEHMPSKWEAQARGSVPNSTKTKMETNTEAKTNRINIAEAV